MSYVIKHGNTVVYKTTPLRPLDGTYHSATFGFMSKRGTLCDFTHPLSGERVGIRQLSSIDKDTLQTLNAEIAKLEEERAKFLREAYERGTKVKVHKEK